MRMGDLKSCRRVVVVIVRWSVERNEGDILQMVEVYAPGENKEVVKQENRGWTH